MCGRFHLGTPAADIARIFGVERIHADWRPRYNIAPSTPVAIIREELDGARRPVRALAMARWGLVPSWADDPAIAYKTINARSEDAAQKPAYRSAFQRRRCVVPADSFYEWKKQGAGASGYKQPMMIRRRDGQPLAMAGLWERWRAKDAETGEWLETCTILTCAPNRTIGEIHDRMPVMLAERDLERWLDTRDHEPGHVQELMHAPPEDLLEAIPVSTRINSPKNDGPECIEAWTAPAHEPVNPAAKGRPDASASGGLLFER